MEYEYFYGLNRSICAVFEEMRKAVKTLNFSYMLSLIEEAQSMANRMEAALADAKDIETMKDEKRELKKQIKALRKKKKKLTPDDAP